MTSGKWDFWIDRGGTFTDIVARDPDGGIRAHKVLSENPEAYRDAAIQGIRELMASPPASASRPSASPPSRWAPPSPPTRCWSARATAPCWSPPAASAMRWKIGYQARPDIFAKEIIKPELLYERVVEVAERVRADGTIEAERIWPKSSATSRPPMTAASAPPPSSSCTPMPSPITRRRSPRSPARSVSRRSPSATRSRR